MKKRLPSDPIFPLAYKSRKIFRKIGGLPPPPTPGELVDEFDALVEGYTNELRRHTQVLLKFFDVIHPESVPWITNFVKKNPGNVRTTLGEPLCIWWLKNVLSESDKSRRIWSLARGPVKYKEEFDAVAASKQESQFALAEVKVSNNQSELEKACQQAVRKASFLTNENPEALQKTGFSWVKNKCSPSEVLVLTLYELGESKDRYSEKLSKELKDKGINPGIARFYDIKDIVERLEKWPKKSENYIELFKTLNHVLEKT